MSDRVQEHLGKAELRIRRYQDYAKFLASADLMFRAAAQEVPELSYYSLYYSFCVAPGGANGGGNDRLVDVFFGQKPYESTQYGPHELIGGKVGRSTKMLVEAGAGLQYQRLDTGSVLCLLYPSRSEHHRPSSEMILLDEINDPSRLMLPQVQARHLRWLAAYMAHTSLDGAITWRQRLRVFWVNHFKQHYRKNKLRRTRAWKKASTVGGWVLTVGLSGFLLYVLQLALPMPDKVAPEITNAKQQAHADADRIDRSFNALREELEVFRASWKTQTTSRKAVGAKPAKGHNKKHH